jgi:hypothetical protein
VTHLERVLHDGEQVDEGVPCLKCHRPLTRVWAYGGGEDGWECKHCRERSTEAQYRFAVKADYIAAAEWLTDVDMTVRTKRAARHREGLGQPRVHLPAPRLGPRRLLGR